MKAWRIVAIVAAVSLLGACSDAGVTDPTLRRAGAMQGGISVLNWNVYVGTDVDAVILALADGFQESDLAVLEAQIQTLFATDFPTRAAAIADEIAERRPDVVGLQEITAFALHSPILGIDADIDFLPILEEALADRGLHYAVAAQNLNIDVTPLPGITMKDYDVMLVNADQVDVLEAWGKTFDLNAGQVAQGIVLERGYVYAEIRIGGKEYTVVSAHPEAGKGSDLSGLRYYQALEIAAAIGDAERAVVMGDLNDVPGSPLYHVFAGTGFTDVWPALHPDEEGLTCCHLTTLMNDVPAFYERIDYLWVRGIEHPVSGLHGSIELLGEETGDRILDAPFYPLWPSDHAGLFGKFLVPVAEELR